MPENLISFPEDTNSKDPEIDIGPNNLAESVYVKPVIPDECIPLNQDLFPVSKPDDN